MPRPGGRLSAVEGEFVKEPRSLCARRGSGRSCALQLRERLADYAAARGIKAQPKKKTGRGGTKQTETSTKDATR